MVTVDFKFTEEQFMQCCARYRQSGRKRWFSIFLRVFAGALCLYQGYQCFQQGQKAYLVFFVFAVVFFAFLGHFMNVLAKAQHRRSPYRDEDVHMEFTDEGMDVKSPTTDVQCRWPAFTAAVEFSDGLMLYRGPLFHWINPEIVTSTGGIAELRDLVRKHVPDYGVRAPLQL